jgi:magnesium transporter
MYKIYKTARGKLSNPEKPVPNSWIDITSPSQEELDELKPYFEIPEEVMVSVRDREEVPKMEEVDDFQFILIQTPYQPETEDTQEGEYLVRPLGIIYNRDYVITITDGPNEVVNYLKMKLKNYSNNRIIDTLKPQRLILKLILFSAKIYLRSLKKINHGIQLAQEEMGKSFDNRDIIKLMDTEKSLTYFNRSLHSNHVIIEKLSKRKFFNQEELDQELVQDVVDENKQALETGKIYENIVTNTANTFSTIISNSVNQNVKFLTSLTIILMLPTLIASVYGMNIALPLQNSPFAFEYVMSISLFLVVGGIIWFYRKKLF